MENATIWWRVVQLAVYFEAQPEVANPEVDYSQEAPTPVEFRLEEIPSGTLLVVTESGFNNFPKKEP